MRYQGGWGGSGGWMYGIHHTLLEDERPTPFFHAGSSDEHGASSPFQGRQVVFGQE